MTTTDASIARVIHLSARRARNSGLWAALASQVNTSAAGSGLAGSSRPGQPISTVVAEIFNETTRDLPAKYKPMIEDYFKSLNRIHGFAGK